MNKLNIIGFLFLVLISSCRKDINDMTENETIDPPIILTYTPSVNNITGSVIGQVVDENNQPMTAVKIKMNGEDYFTNEFGHFIINDVTMNSLGQFVQAKRNATHFPGSRRFFPQEGQTSKVKIQMIKKDFNAEFFAEEGATVLIEGGAKIDFEPNSIKDSNGNIFEGTVQVASHWLDPLARETFDKMPGNLQGVNTLSEEVALQTFGMIAVELRSPNGEKLNIADGKTATITMPVSDELLTITPEEIPLWSFNEEYGLWQEESSATLQNNTYVGEVSHFSFWNYDNPYSLVELMITYTGPNGNPLSGHLVKVELGNGATGAGYTDMNGKVVGLFPANEILTFSILDECGGEIASQNFGPFNSDTDLGTVGLLVPNANNTILKGTLRDCDNNLITNGLVVTTMNGYQSYFYVGSGEFEIFLTSCFGANNIEVYGVNLDDLEQGLTVTATSQTTNDLGDLSTCGSSLDNYIKLTIDGETRYAFDLIVDIGSGGVFESYMYTNVFPFVGIGFGGMAVGDYSAENFIEGITFDDWSIYQISNTTPPFTSFNVTQYDTKLVGTFSGQVMNNSTSVFLEGEFNIKL